LRYLHGLGAVAALKLQTVRTDVLSCFDLHGLGAVAALKQDLNLTGGPNSDADLHGLGAVAALKQKVCGDDTDQWVISTVLEPWPH